MNQIISGLTNSATTKISKRVSAAEATDLFDGKVVTRETLITPAMAKEWLEKHNTLNRTMMKSRVDAYAHEMRHDNWKVTHQGIAFGKDGRLVDGQHRLSAIVLVDKSVKMQVSWNVDGPIDVGRSRTPGDRAQFDGFENTNALMAVCGTLYRITTGCTGILTPSMQDSARGTYAKTFEDVHARIGRLAKSRSSYWIAAFVFAYPVHPVAVSQFLDSLSSMVNLQEGSPVLAFSALLNQKPKTPKEKEIFFYKTLSCIRSYAQGKSISKIYGDRAVFEWWAKQREKVGA